MIGHFVIGGQQVRVFFDRPVCLAMVEQFAGPQPRYYGTPPAGRRPMEAGGFVGDITRGGSCNVDVITITPHCNGTHTESVSHIVNEQVPVWEVAPAGPTPACLACVAPVRTDETSETYRPALARTDQLITATALALALDAQPDPWVTAVVLRTRPKGWSQGNCLTDTNPPFFTVEAMDYLRTRGVKHLLVDLPSVDRMRDEGLLTAHHHFWNVPEGTHEMTSVSHRDRTITELIVVPEDAPDGHYLLWLELPRFSSDAAPSSPSLFPVEFV